MAGSRKVDAVSVDEMLLGTRRYRDLYVPLLDRSDIGADGILGLDSLQDQRILLDFERGLMAIEDARKSGTRGYEIIVAARRKSGQLVVTNAEVDGIDVAVVIDTGSDSTIGNFALRDLMMRRIHKEQASLHSVTGQQIAANVATARRLEVQRLTLDNILIAFADSPAFEAIGLENRPAIFLGVRELSAFDRVAIDFAKRRILFDLPPTLQFMNPRF
ncbi:hypothetical protein GCM10011371_32180 [Novosphingobium marinum]|uniref:Peptidase A2 domain-containing protein n=1 Tax=Novosphingobium marinum TaxID=1514948 RepID=A0A7Z0BX28_9SPHN|nr:hypothetical protein [Novosphingobium marinum]NYH96922.1 hypothetical protein [Novosphingobium marinum]GGC42340.1 hypothetical protein GCM10011371_32180 [Novosphingobium marinum]